jgi:hypothetical protein
MIIVAMLMCMISFELQLTSCITIHNQCLNTKLVSPVYFSNGAVFPKPFDQQIEIDAALRTCFEIKATQNDFEGALLFKLQGCADSQYNMDTSTIETGRNEPTYVYMLVVWRVTDAKPFAYVTFIEHIKEFTWNEDKLKKLYDKHHWWFKRYDDAISDTWLMDNNVILRTTLKVKILKGNFELSISVSKEEKYDDAIRPLYIDFER